MMTRTALVAVSAAAVIVALAGCSTTASTAAAAPAAIQSKATEPSSPSNPLVGTWQTAAIPAASFGVTYRHAGGTPAEAAQFLIGYGKTARVSVRLSGTDWVQFEQQDNQAPDEGWAGTYTISANTIHTTDGELANCHIAYTYTLSGDQLRLRVVSDDCGDGLIARSLYETAAFQRIG